MRRNDERYLPQSELQRRLERDVLAVVPEDADLAIQQRDSLCRAAGTRRESALSLFQRDGIQQANRR